MAYLIIGGGYWARSETIAAAKRAFVKSGGSLKESFGVYEVPSDYYIDELGNGHGSAPAKLIDGADQIT